jgi:hypothetical protein
LFLFVVCSGCLVCLVTSPSLSRSRLTRTFQPSNSLTLRREQGLCHSHSAPRMNTVSNNESPAHRQRWSPPVDSSRVGVMLMLSQILPSSSPTTLTPTVLPSQRRRQGPPTITTTCTSPFPHLPYPSLTSLSPFPCSGDWVCLNGNQIGILFADYVWRHYRSSNPPSSYPSAFMLNSTVSSSFLSRMASAQHFHHEDTLTGFKWHEPTHIHPTLTRVSAVPACRRCSCPC